MYLPSRIHAVQFNRWLHMMVCFIKMSKPIIIISHTANSTGYSVLAIYKHYKHHNSKALQQRYGN